MCKYTVCRQHEQLNNNKDFASFRYPIQVPREGCYGDMDGQPGVRNYGTMDPDDLFDVYCYAEQINGMNYDTLIISVCKSKHGMTAVLFRKK